MGENLTGELTMKKLLALLLVICAVALTFTGCDIASIVNKAMETEEPTYDPTLPRTYTYGQLNITLPAGFGEDSEGVYKNGEYVVRCAKMAFSSITPKEGYDFPTLVVFMKECPFFNETVAVKDQDGILYVDYDTKASPSNISSVFKVQNDGMQCIMGFESDSAFYLVSFYSASLDYETVKAQAFEWAKTITFGE